VPSEPDVRLSKELESGPSESNAGLLHLELELGPCEPDIRLTEQLQSKPSETDIGLSEQVECEPSTSKESPLRLWRSGKVSM